MDSVNISGLSKASVLMALFNNSHQQGMGFFHTEGAKQMSLEDAQAIIDEYCRRSMRLYFDYLLGRVMKVDITGDSFRPLAYDRDVGDGAAATTIAALRASAVAENAGAQ